MSAIEAELVKIFKFKKSPEDFEDHQEYLSELVLCVEKIKDDKTWDSMNEETYDWLTEAVEAKNKKREIPDFTDAEPAEPEEDGDEEGEPTKVDEEATEEEAEEDPGEGTEEEVGREPASIEAVVGEVVAEVGGPDATTEDAVPAKKPRKKRVKAGKYIKKKKGKPDVQPKHKPGKEPDYKKITGTKDRYGVTEGTKASLALKMFEKGCTMRDVVIEHGDTQYNILRKLAKEGHKVEKLENGVLRLTHKDDVAKKGKGK